jgi:hypothetical protein
MNVREANELGYREAKAHPILIFGLYGICAGVVEFAEFLVLEDSSLLGDEFYHRFGPHFVWHDDRAHPIERRLSAARWSQTDMGTIAVWAFFILWGIGLIQSLVHRNLSLAFNFAFQCT